MRIIRFAFAAVTLALTVSLRAESPETRRWSLQDCIQQALEHNLNLRIARYDPQVKLYDVKGAYGAYDPEFYSSGQHSDDKAGSRYNPDFGITLPGQERRTDTLRSTLGGDLPWGTRYDLGFNASDTEGRSFGVDTNLNLLTTPFDSSSGSVSLDVTQPLWQNFWYNRTRLGIRILKNTLKQSELGLRSTIMGLVLQVEQAYYALQAGYENVKVQESALELAQRLLAENKKRVEVGALAPLDEKQSEAQVAARQSDLLSAQRDLAKLENTLIGLLTDDFASWTQVKLEPSETLKAERQLFNLQDSWSKALTQSPTYLAAQIGLESQGIQVKIDRNGLYPQVNLKAGGSYSGSRNEFSGVLGDIEQRDEPYWYLGGEFRYALGNRAGRYAYRTSKANYETVSLRLKQMEQDIMINVDNAIKNAQASYERVDATRKAREYAEAALAAEQKKLESGKSTSFIVLQLQRDLTDARSSEIGALTTYNIALASLASAEGSILERNRIDLEVK